MVYMYVPCRGCDLLHQYLFGEVAVQPPRDLTQPHDHLLSDFGAAAFARFLPYYWKMVGKEPSVGRQPWVDPQ